MTSTEIFYVENMRCSGCVNTIVSALMKQAGVQGVDISLEEKKVSVMGIGLDRDLIIKTLEKLGYPLSGHNSLLRKATSFISCSVGR
jgi:copper chaperone CopZ